MSIHERFKALMEERSEEQANKLLDRLSKKQGNPRGGIRYKGGGKDNVSVLAHSAIKSKTVHMDPRDLTPTQAGVTKGGVKHYLGDNNDRKPITAIKVGGKVWIIDGHHRHAADTLRDRKSLTQIYYPSKDFKDAVEED